MTRRNPSGHLLFDNEIESTARRNRREIRRSLRYIEEGQEDEIHTTNEEMADNQNNPLPPAIAANLVEQNPAPRTMYDYAKPTLTGTESSIVRPADEDPNTHLVNFLELYDTFKINGMDLETLYDAWERYKDLLRRCPHHGLPLWLQVQTFYNGVNPSTRQLIDAAADGTLIKKTPEEAYEFVEQMSLNNYQWQVMRTKPTKAGGVFNLDTVHPVMRCDSNGGMHNPDYPSFNPGIEEEQVGGTIPISRGVVKEIKDHNILWPPYQEEKKLNLEEMLMKFIAISETHFQNTETALKNQQASIQGLENQIGQLAKMIFERPQGSLPSNSKTNPREQLNVITVRDEEGLVEPEPEPRKRFMVSKGKDEVDHSARKPISREYKPRVPYPSATRKDHTDEQFGKLLKLLKKLHINLPFIEALLQMPNLVKFLKEFLTNKWKLDDASHVELNAVCSTILQNRLPNKLKDPGSFMIPCLIGSLNVNNALADLGASINESPRKNVMEHHFNPCHKNRATHEERRLKIDELDEWRTHVNITRLKLSEDNRINSEKEESRLRGPLYLYKIEHGRVLGRVETGLKIPQVLSHMAMNPNHTVVRHGRVRIGANFSNFNKVREPHEHSTRACGRPHGVGEANNIAHSRAIRP
ncbi:hypothetical protein CXB51_010359 [Gossypium anomalum]|uniref:Retrotransposon gag domain-containing protein n=1 Tax=Gossypium anomalum TaxID=47600 RepID=A0A8J5Z303_9ROSI|nr:hypothetical protein CXB51_010359 [Gossypium anomalum]